MMTMTDKNKKAARAIAARSMIEALACPGAQQEIRNYCAIASSDMDSALGDYFMDQIDSLYETIYQAACETLEKVVSRKSLDS